MGFGLLVSAAALLLLSGVHFSCLSRSEAIAVSFGLSGL